MAGNVDRNALQNALNRITELERISTNPSQGTTGRLASQNNHVVSRCDELYNRFPSLRRPSNPLGTSSSTSSSTVATTANRSTNHATAILFKAFCKAFLSTLSAMLGYFATRVTDHALRVVVRSQRIIIRVNLEFRTKSKSAM